MEGKKEGRRVKLRAEERGKIDSGGWREKERKRASQSSSTFVILRTGWQTS